MKEGQQGKIPEQNFEIQTFNGIHGDIVKGAHQTGTIQTGWRRERATYFPLKIYLRKPLSSLRKSLDKFMGEDKLRHMYISGPPGSGKTTYCLFYFTLYMTKNSKKGLIIQYRKEAENEVMIVEGQEIRRVTGGTDDGRMPDLVRSLIVREGRDAFDFVVFDGVRTAEMVCGLVSSVIVNNVGSKTKIIKITSLEFDVKGGDSTGGLDGIDEFFTASSWKYDDYKNAVDAGLFEPDALERIVCVDSDYEPETDTEDGDAKMEDAEENKTQKEIAAEGVERLEWLKSLLPRKYYYAGGSARFMFEYSICQLIVSYQDKDSVLKRICNRLTPQDWEAFATLKIAAGTKSSVSSGMQRIDGEYVPVSKYFLHVAHQECKAKLTRSVRTAAEASNNPALKGWAFELEQLDIVEHEMAADTGALVSEDETLVLPVPSESTTYDGIGFNARTNGDAFTIWCSKWNQGCFDVAFYIKKKLITMNFTISSSHSLKVNPLRDLVDALLTSGKAVQSLSHIAIVEEKGKCDNFTFEDPEGAGKEGQQTVFSVETARSQKINATRSRHGGAATAPLYGFRLKTVTVYPREWTSPRKRKKVDYSGVRLCKAG